MILHIDDDFDIQKIADSGQCFRVKAFDNGLYRFVTQASVLYIRKCSDNRYDVSCTKEEWNRIWSVYFDIPRNYSQIRSLVPSSDRFMKNAMITGTGLRILHQDPWETLITFIISQCKNIPSIKASVELLSAKFGQPIVTPFEKLHLFPTVKQLSAVSDAAWSECKLGYRTPYIQDAVQRVLSNQTDLNALADFHDLELLDALKQIRGVGDKVANCVSLFAYGRMSLVPIDTWINKVIVREYKGNEPFAHYGEYAGIMQQYIFYYAQTHKKEI